MFQPCYTHAFVAKLSWRLRAISSAQLLVGCGWIAAPLYVIFPAPSGAHEGSDAVAEGEELSSV
jgi:hypothetical protein